MSNNKKIINEEILDLLREYVHENEDGVEDPYKDYKEAEEKCKTIMEKYNIANEETPAVVNYPIGLGLLDKLVIALSTGVTGDTPDVILYEYSKDGNPMDPYDISIIIYTTNIFGVYIYIKETFDGSQNYSSTEIKLINDFDYEFYKE